MLSYSTYVVIISVIIGLFYLNKFKNTIYKYFVYYLIYVLTTDILGFICNKLEVKYDSVIYNSDVVYNIYFIFTYLFYYLLYKKLFKSRKKKQLINYIILIYLIFTFIDLFIIKSSFINGFITNNIVFGAILLIVIIILFLIDIISDDNIVFNIRKSLIFWISIGVLLFYIGVIPIIISSKYLKYDGIYDGILLVLNIIMYGCFTIGFIKSDPKYNY